MANKLSVEELEAFLDIQVMMSFVQLPMNKNLFFTNKPISGGSEIPPLEWQHKVSSPR